MPWAAQLYKSPVAGMGQTCLTAPVLSPCTCWPLPEPDRAGTNTCLLRHLRPAQTANESLRPPQVFRLDVNPSSVPFVLLVGVGFHPEPAAISIYWRGVTGNDRSGEDVFESARCWTCGDVGAVAARGRTEAIRQATGEMT